MIDADIARKHYGIRTSVVQERRAVSSPANVVSRVRGVLAATPWAEIAWVFAAYFVAGKLGQATTNIRSSNLGPVWPAYGIAVASLLAYGYRVWPGIAASAFLIAYLSPVPALAALGQATGATTGAAIAVFSVRRIPHFDPKLSRLGDAIAFITRAAFGSAVVSSAIGLASLYLTHVQAYSGLGSAWVVYWLGDSTGVLLVTPLVFTFSTLLTGRSRQRAVELAALVTISVAACLVVFGDLPLVPVRLHVLAFAVLPLVMWAAIDFGIGGAAMSVFMIATIATLSTALGLGPFAGNTPFVGAVLLDVLFMVLAVSGLTLAAVIAEREQAEAARAGLVRERTALETRLHLAAIVESSNDAIVSTDIGGTILSWNAAAQHIFEFTAAEAVGRPGNMLIPSIVRDEDNRVVQRLAAGERIDHFETIRVTRSGKRVPVSLTISPLSDADGCLVGAANIYRDITEQKRAQETMSTVNRRLIEAQEQERSRIARELHDDIAQRLAVLAFEVDDLTAISTAASPLRDKTIALKDRVSEIASDVQGLSHELHSPRLRLLGLAGAMKAFCEQAARQHAATVDFETHDVPNRVPSDVSLCLFRVLQEAVHNAAKHSGVQRVQARLWGTPGQIHLAISDQGAGFDVEVAKAGPGIGLISMAERMKLVDGDFAIESRPQHGATIRVRVPVFAERRVAESMSETVERDRPGLQ